MINIDRHIEILMLDNDCVIVPGLGAFIAHYMPACYDDSTETFLPPYRTVGFNAQLRMNDSLLAQSYIEALDISYPEAVRVIDDEVAELRDILNNKGEFELTDIGVLKINDQGNIEFTPYESGILTPTLYGLNSLDILPLANIAKTHDTKVIDLPIKDKETDEIDSEQESSEDTISIKLSTIRYAMATAAAVLCLLLFSLPLGNTDNSTTYIKSSMDTGLCRLLTPEKPVEIVQKTEFVNTPVTEEITPKTTEEKAPVAKKEEATTKTYTIVLAARISQANAKEYVAKLKKNGINAKIVTNGSNVKVVTGNFPSEEKARDYLRSKRFEDNQFDEAWILKL